MRGRNYLHSFATLFIILVLLIIVGCQQSINLPPEPGIYLMEEGNPIMITKIEPDSSGERYPDESIPTIGIPSPVFYITDPEIDTNYLVLLFLNGEESVR